MEAAAAHYTPPMRFTIVGSGAVGGYYGAKLARAGHDVTFIARGAHLDAIRRDGLSVKSPLGDFTVQARAESDPAEAPAGGRRHLCRQGLQQRCGASSARARRPRQRRGADAAERRRQRRRARGGHRRAPACSAARPTSPRRLRRRASSSRPARTAASSSARCSATRRASRRAFRRFTTRSPSADIESEPVADAHAADLGEVLLSRARSPRSPVRHGCRSDRSGPTRSSDSGSSTPCDEVESVARAEGVDVPRGMADQSRRLHRQHSRHDPLVAAHRSAAGKTDRGRSAARRGVPPGGPAQCPASPIMSALYAVLKPHAAGTPFRGKIVGLT